MSWKQTKSNSLIIFYALIMYCAVWFAWNFVMPEFSMPKLNYLQVVCIHLLALFIKVTLFQKTNSILNINQTLN